MITIIFEIIKYKAILILIVIEINLSKFLQFVLDHLPLSKSEKMLTAENQIFTIHRNQSVSLNSSISTYVDVHDIYESETNQQTTLTSNPERSLTKSKKKSNMREAIIAEIDQEKGEFKQLPDIVASSHLGNYTKTLI